MRFSLKEVRGLFLSWVLISVAFAILFGEGIAKSVSYGFLTVFLVSALTAGIGFLLHEMMHKSVAQSYGLHAEFKPFYSMLGLTVLLSFFGFIIAAPGAVEVQGPVNDKKNGKISVAGPATNIVLAVLFLVPSVFYSFEGILQLIFDFGFRINALFALFNMIPIMSLDGVKIVRWNKPVFYTLLVISLLLSLASFII